MKITERQKKLLDLINIDQEKAMPIYKASSYWSYKCKKASHWIVKNGFSDMRGLNSPVLTSIGDNLVLDKRNEFGLGFLSKILKIISYLPIINRLYANQVVVTKNYLNSYIKNAGYFYQNNERVKYLLENYKLKDTTLFGCEKVFEYKGESYSGYYLEQMDVLDEVNKVIDLKNIKSVFEIGGGFGSSIHILLQNFKNIKKIIYLDLAPYIFPATEYLRHFYGDSVKDYLDHKDKEIKFSDNDELEIFCITPWQIKNVKSKIDYFHAVYSFQGMTAEVIKNYSDYMKSLLSLKGGIILTCFSHYNAKTLPIDKIIEVSGINFDKKEFPLFNFNNEQNCCLLVHKK